ncbi:srs domain-containing protein [Cystoisospora suis]|uniref:Srs domain-containing protein n=1 Tax=Cystoisospora suis TaxID=483139 RepID=A0A2C6KV07_9APIC|nr:srs domain-containing protein [Cystoisospora suis]
MASSRWSLSDGPCIWGGRVGFKTNRAITLLLVACACLTVPAQGVPGDSDPNPQTPPAPQSPLGQCTAKDGATSCSCGAAADKGRSGAAVQQQVTLSDDSPKLDLTCTGAGVSGVPATMVDGDVCPQKPDVSLCGDSSEAPNITAVKLNTLLASSAAIVTWKLESNGIQDQKKYSLNVPVDAFPLVDKEFFVGCKETSAPVCKVSVALKARKSTTVGQAVTCAYGAASNAKRQSVTLTPSNNKLTITCGKEGEIVPTGNLTKLCVHGGDPTNASCSPQAFTELFPGSVQSWWSIGEGNQAVLTIPADKFPVEERKFALGCKYTPPASKPDNTRDAQSSASPSVCSVDVIVAKQSPTTTTTSSTSSAFSSVCVSRTSVNVVVGLLSLGALQAVSLLG